ncbi:TPA: hypothetical protein U0616_001845 [Streptococcus suis]|nr:hypothetical protein [Streptococcus suis]
MANMTLDANRKEFIQRLFATNMTNEEVAPYLSLSSEKVAILREQLA